MMRVATRLAPSPIEGLGLFAAESIAEGALVWRYDPGLDLALDPGFLDRTSGPEADFVGRYSYLDLTLGRLIVCLDDARFMNHADEPNVSEPRGGACFALRPISIGDELTCDYRRLDSRPMRFETN